MKDVKVIILALVFSVTVGSNIHTEPASEGSPTENPQSLINEHGEVSWHTEVVDNDDVKGWTSIALSSTGYPRISYTGYDASGYGLLRYAYNNGSAWHTETVNPGVNHQDQNTSIAIDSSNYPHISFSETDYDDVWYAKKIGSSWNVVPVDASGNVGTYCALALDTSDYPHISYYDGGSDDRDLKYAFWNGSSWTREKPKTYGDVGRHTSIDLDSGNYPHISYHHGDDNDVLYSYKDASGWDWLTAGDTGFYESYTSIALDKNNNDAYISYRKVPLWPGAPSLMCARYQPAHGSWSRYDVDGYSFTNIGKTSSIAVDNSTAPVSIHIGYFGPESQSLSPTVLKYAYYYGIWYKEVVDTSGDLAMDNTIDIAIDDASPRPHVHMSYYDEVNEDLKYAFRNNVPWATSVSISPEFPADGDALDVNYIYNDGNNDPSTGTLIKWYIDGDHDPLFDGDLTILATATTLGEEWEFSVTPNDGYDSGTEVFSGAVRINALPVASNLTLTPETAYTNNPLNGEYAYSDANSDPRSTLTEIRWFKDGAPAGNDDNMTLPYSATQKHQTWYFTVRPHDGFEYGDTAESNHVTILNTIPTISPPFLAPTRPATTQDIDLHYTFYDADADYPGGDSDQSEIRWWRTTSPVPGYDDHKTIPGTVTSAGEYWEAVVVPYDGEDYNDQQGADPYATVNWPPYAWNYGVIPANPGDDDDLTADYEFIDWDVGDVENTHPVNGTQIRWFKDTGTGPVLQPLYNNLLTVSKDDTTPGEDWHFTVQPHDYIEYGDVATSDPPTRINSLPVISNLSLTPATPYTTDPLTAIYDVFDADGDDDHSEFLWYIDGEGEQTGYNDNPLPAGVAKKGEQWYVTVNSFDGHEYGNSLTSSTVTVINSPPFIHAARITPYPWTESDLHARYRYSDNDGDPESECEIRWYKDDVLQTGHNDSLYVLSSATEVGEKWYFTVRSSDGTEFSTLVKSEEVIISADPGEPPGCFLSGTSILLADRSEKPIEDIEVGDVVLSYDEHSGKIKPDRVNKVFRHPKEDTYLIVNGHLRVTPVHPVLSKGKWVPIGDLKVGDKLTNSKGDDVQIESVIAVKESVDVYNFEVNPCHTYVAEGYVVHNRKPNINEPEIVVPDVADVETVADATTKSAFIGVENQLPDAVFELSPLVPEAHALYQNVPNPFNPETSIQYDVPAGGGVVTLRIYDVQGKMVRTLVNSHQTPGEHTATWNAKDDQGNGVATGVYFYRLTAPGFVETRKMVLLR